MSSKLNIVKLLNTENLPDGKDGYDNITTKTETPILRIKCMEDMIAFLEAQYTKSLFDGDSLVVGIWWLRKLYYGVELGDQGRSAIEKEYDLFNNSKEANQLRYKIFLEG